MPLVARIRTIIMSQRSKLSWWEEKSNKTHITNQWIVKFVMGKRIMLIASGNDNLLRIAQYCDVYCLINCSRYQKLFNILYIVCTLYLLDRIEKHFYGTTSIQFVILRIDVVSQKYFFKLSTKLQCANNVQYLKVC